MNKSAGIMNPTGLVLSASWLESIDDLVFYAIDKASPYNLALNPLSDSISKISKLSFTQLMIDKTGITVMWTILNAGLSNFGYRPVSPESASMCKTAGSVLDAAKKTSGGSS